MRHRFLQVLTIFTVLCCLLSVVWSQNAPAVHGYGTSNKIAKFNGSTSIGDTAIYERDGCISETPNFLTTVAGIFCLHDLGGGATVHVATNLVDRVAFIAENDSEAGNPVGIEGFVPSSEGGIGVFGGSANSVGNGVGVYGNTQSPQGFGVLGRNDSTVEAARARQAAQGQPSGLAPTTAPIASQTTVGEPKLASAKVQ